MVECEVAEKTLYGVNRHRAVEFRSVAYGFAGVVADTPMNRGEGIVGYQFEPGVVIASRLRMSQPSLDVRAGWAARVARRQQIDVKRPALPGWPGIGALVEEVRQRCDIRASSGHTRRSVRGADLEVPESLT